MLAKTTTTKDKVIHAEEHTLGNKHLHSGMVCKLISLSAALFF